MKKFLLLLPLALLLACTPQDKKSNPDLILLNGKIWTAEGAATFAEAIAITGNTISAVGNSSDIKKLAGDSTQIIDLNGKLVTPGFNDAHIHFLSGSLGLAEVELTETKSMKEVLANIKKYAADFPDRKWITGRGWQYTMFPGGLPTKKMLDSLVSDRPIMIRAYDGHSAWVNSKALELAGIDRNTKFNGFGELVRDGSGEPTGALKEGAMHLVGKLVPEKTREENLEALRLGMKLAAQLGITSIQNASGNLDETSLYEELLKNNELSLRVSVAFSVNDQTTNDDIQSYVQVRDRVGNNSMLRAHAVKFMIDGVIEGHTAFMLQPYVDVVPKELSATGQVAMPLPAFGDLVATFDSLGFQIYTHAIGDRGVRETLNVYESAAKKNGPRDSRHRIEHIETINPSDIPRFAQLGVMPSMEPIHAEPGTVAVWQKAIGEQRLPYSFAWASMLKANAKLVFSSDWPACVSLNPIRGLYTAVTRRTIDGQPETGWVPEQKVSMPDALLAYTHMGAYASFEDTLKGKIKPGFLADVIVLSQDLFTINPMDTYKTNVMMTVFDGKVIYERDN
jgi:predicted amidohydrolase YtcJ